MAMGLSCGPHPGTPVMRHALTGVFVAAALFGAGPLRHKLRHVLGAARSSRRRPQLVQTMKATDQFRSITSDHLGGLKPAIVQALPENGEGLRRDHADHYERHDAAIERLGRYNGCRLCADFSVDELTIPLRSPDADGPKLVARGP